MMLFRKTVMNGLVLEEYPFLREFELEGCLESNPELLSLDDDALRVPQLIAVEAFIKKGRGQKDGRADMLVSYDGGQIGIVELKRGRIGQQAYNQLKEYLKSREGLANLPAFKDYLKLEENMDFDLNDDDNFIGVLVGQGVDDDVLRLICDNKNSPRIYAIDIRRLKTIKDIFVLSSVIGSRNRDFTKYRIDNGVVKYGKGRLVLEVIRRYVMSKNHQVSYAELEKVFPARLRGVKRKGLGCFLHRDDAMRQFKETGYARHYLKDGEFIRLADGEIAVSSQWGVGNITTFIRHAEKVLSVRIREEQEAR